MKAAYVVHWTEFERGWGSRPDGYTICRDKQIAESVIAEFNEARIQECVKNGGIVPDDYSNPGVPYLCEVTDEAIKRLKKESHFSVPQIHKSQFIKWSSRSTVVAR